MRIKITIGKLVAFARLNEARTAKLIWDNLPITVKATTNSKHDYPVWPNVLNRSFTVEKPNSVWVSDITYIWTFEGWLYLAAILDLFSRGNRWARDG